MSRYTRIPIIKTVENPVRRYANVKYPSITIDPFDIYAFTVQGDRYDIMAQKYYNDSSLWWIIARANTFQTPDSLYPNIGVQLRIPNPNRIANIISSYERLNEII